jgi:omega-6 fatty acid desaturase (delta-12 desaturase)
MDRLHLRRNLRNATKAFQKTSHIASTIQILITLLPLITLAVIATRLLQTNPYISFLLAIPMASLVIRTFMLQHDCSHGSFFRGKNTNYLIGFILGIITMTPYACWRKFHLMHHAGNGNLEKRGFGDIKTMTVDEYQMMGPKARIRYRVYRHPFIMFGIGAFLFFVIRQRFTLKLMPQWKCEVRSVHLTNFGITIIIFSILLFCHRPAAALALYAAVMFLAAGVGVWLFYIQHQFPEAYWAHETNWSFHDAAIDGSSYYELPFILRWITANIGFHHIHHLNPAIPNYSLARCHAAIPGLRDGITIKLGQSFSYAMLALWDPTLRRMVSFKSIATDAVNRASQAHE